MPTIEIASPASYLGIILFAAGIILVAVGSGTLKVQGSIIIEPGLKTLAFGIVLLLFGSSLWVLDSLGVFTRPTNPTLTPIATVLATTTVLPTSTITVTNSPTPASTSTVTATPPVTATIAITLAPTVEPTRSPIIVNVAANSSWQSTGVFIEEGETVVIRSRSGQWSACAISGCPYVGPEGWVAPNQTPEDSRNSVSNVVPGCPHLALIARVSSDGQPVCIGNGLSRQFFSSGELQLQANDIVLSDNDGVIKISIRFDD